MANCEIEREKFYPGPGLEPGPLALCASALPLPWISTCPGWRSGSALARKARGPGSSPGPG